MASAWDTFLKPLFVSQYVPMALKVTTRKPCIGKENWLTWILKVAVLDLHIAKRTLKHSKGALKWEKVDIVTVDIYMSLYSWRDEGAWRSMEVDELVTTTSTNAMTTMMMKILWNSIFHCLSAIVSIGQRYHTFRTNDSCSIPEHWKALPSCTPVSGWEKPKYAVVWRVQFYLVKI